MKPFFWHINFMHEFWLNIYYQFFAPHRKIGRGSFNLILLAASVPIAVLQFNDLMQMGRDIAARPEAAMALLNATNGPGLAAFLDVLIYIALVPLFAMRMNDIEMDLKWLGLVYAPIILAKIDVFTGLALPWPVTAPLWIASLFLTSKLCMQQHVERMFDYEREEDLPPHQRKPATMRKNRDDE